MTAGLPFNRERKPFKINKSKAKKQKHNTKTKINGSCNFLMVFWNYRERENKLMKDPTLDC
jgi:hypothetical protein